ncbi:hypothetical protein BP00DRAFT_3476 [Aspergillus indologenus CBS 114.80]|uniref:Cysteine-rich secreted protein n=1 Tax=Aspergillus indologenus CBS 114.80 TaxID=1450541 RepID=A0A2V5IN35_9EURO|nr:hypothetical protein BP00DRAFT_3476 [Aspergillus indologenus CBS 114.80]
MKAVTSWSLVALLLQAAGTNAAIRTDLGARNVQIAEMDGTGVRHGDQIVFSDPRSDFEEYFRCAPASGKHLTFSASGRYAACCYPSQQLIGSTDTAFDCCGEGHELAGSDRTGYRCCPISQIFDGQVCKAPQPVCTKGKVLVNNKCVCPAGYFENALGNCERTCTSGISTGKCYTFTWENAERLGFNAEGYYLAAQDDLQQKFGKFQLCKDEVCTPNLPVNPEDGFRIKDLHGNPVDGQQPGLWLNNAHNGGQIGKTVHWDKSGEFSLTKWPCGKYCLTGYDHGLGVAYPALTPAFTFTTYDQQSCIPIDITEVPCDVRHPNNNCIWKNGKDQCCNSVDCPAQV